MNQSRKRNRLTSLRIISRYPSDSLRGILQQVSENHTQILFHAVGDVFGKRNIDLHLRAGILCHLHIIGNNRIDGDVLRVSDILVAGNGTAQFLQVALQFIQPSLLEILLKNCQLMAVIMPLPPQFSLMFQQAVLVLFLLIDLSVHQIQLILLLPFPAGNLNGPPDLNAANHTHKDAENQGPNEEIAGCVIRNAVRVVHQLHDA